MRKGLIFFLLLSYLFADRIFAQGYPPILNNSCWRVYVGGFTNDRRFFWIIPGGDTVLGGKTFTKFIDSARGHALAYVREDLAAKKVYRWNGVAEYMLFDFSMHVGNSYNYGSLTFTVVNEDSILVGPGIKRRALSLTADPNFGPTDYWIEGVGSLGVPLWKQVEHPSDPSFYLICSFQNGINIYQRESFGIFCNGNCCLEPPKVGNSEEKFGKWFPNPFTNSSTYLSPTQLNNASIIIMNMQGQVIKQIQTFTGRIINLNSESIPNGIYSVLIINGDNSVTTTRFVIAGK